MEYIDLKKQYEVLKGKIDNNIQKVLKDADYIMGEEVKILRRKISKICWKKILCYMCKWDRCINNSNESI